MVREALVQRSRNVWLRREQAWLSTYAKDANAASAVVKAIEHDGGKAVAIQADAEDVEAVRGRGRKNRRDLWPN